ncbi:MAG: 50S ribosomal protein L9 [Actinomycetaceae bacterium]|nr:50S ribosomal protein L9 [Actinomycetaceae bacterium]
MKNTKIILTADVPQLGSSGDVVTVKAGYARNLLLPRKLAERWSPKAQRQIDQMLAARRRREIASAEDARAVRDAIEEGGNIEVFKRASDNGSLFGSVSTREIAEAIYEQLHQTVDRRKIQITQPLKAVGTYTVSVTLHEDVSVEVKVDVKPQK